MNRVILILWVAMLLFYVSAETATYQKVGVLSVRSGIERVFVSPVRGLHAALKSEMSLRFNQEDQISRLYGRIAELESTVLQQSLQLDAERNALQYTSADIEKLKIQLQTTGSMNESVSFNPSRATLVFKENFWNIGLGSQDGIQVGAYVLKSGSVVGVVTRVGSTSSRFLPLTQLNSPISVMVVDDQGKLAKGLLFNRSSKLILEFIENGRNIPFGVFLYSGLPSETGFPVVLGLVQEKSSSSEALHQSFLVNPMYEVMHGDLVYVLNMKTEEQ